MLGMPSPMAAIDCVFARGTSRKLASGRTINCMYMNAGQVIPCSHHLFSLLFLSVLNASQSMVVISTRKIRKVIHHCH